MGTPYKITQVADRVQKPVGSLLLALRVEFEEPRRVIVRAGPFTFANKSFMLEEDEYFDVPESEHQAQLLVYLVLEKYTLHPRVLFDYTENNRSQLCYSFGVQSPLIEVYNLLILQIAPGKASSLRDHAVGSIFSVTERTP
jgi:hypothetical protein